MKDYFNSLVESGQFLSVTYGQWLHIFFVITTAIVIYFVLKFILSLIDHILFQRTSFSFEAFESLKGPIAMFLAALYLRVSENSIALPKTAEGIWYKAIAVIFSAATFWALYKLVDPISKTMARAAERTESNLDDQLVPLLSKTAKIVIVILALLTIIQSLGVNVFSLVAGLGIGGLAIALAAKDTAANFFGSLMILFDQPFKIGDWIKMENIEGTVTDIGFRSTRIKTFYDSEVVIPNSTVANANIDNMGRRQFRRVYTSLGLTYSTTKEQMESFTKGLKDIITKHPNTRKDKIHVNFNSMGESALDVLVYYFIAVNNYEAELKTKEDVLLEAMKLAKNCGVDFAFPSRSLYLEKQNLDLLT